MTAGVWPCFNVRSEDARPCVLVIIGATEDGTKELLAIADGFRESKDSWLELLRELKAHGLSRGPKLAIADGALGFWPALQEACDPGIDQQRCWVHKTANVLDNCPRACKGAPRNCSMASTWRPPSQTPSKRMIGS